MSAAGFPARRDALIINQSLPSIPKTGDDTMTHVRTAAYARDGVRLCDGKQDAARGSDHKLHVSTNDYWEC